MKKDVAEYVARCLICLKVKIEHRRPMGLLQPLEIPAWKWDSVAMDFVTGLPVSRNRYNSIWVIVDRFSKAAVFLPIRDDWGAEKLAEEYVSQVVKRFGIPSSIISDRDPKFRAQFWQSLQREFGTQLRFSTAFHPMTDGQTERTIQTLEDMLRACVLQFQGSWVDRLALIEFSYNNSYHASIQAAPFEVLYGRRCRTPMCWEDPSDRVLLGPDLVAQTTDHIRLIRDRIKAAQDRQKSYADRGRRPGDFEIGDCVLLRVSPSKGVMRFGRKGKLSPRYIGPYSVVERIGKPAYRLDLPPELGRVHDVFHVSQLRRCVADESLVLQPDEVELSEDLSYEERPVRVLAREDKVMRNRRIPLVKILWHRRGVEEATWETEADMRARYPELFTP